jgi:hypothetical protein
MKALKNAVILLGLFSALVSIYPIGYSFTLIYDLNAEAPFGAELFLAVALSLTITTVLLLSWEGVDYLQRRTAARANLVSLSIAPILALCLLVLILSLNSFESFFERSDPFLVYRYYFNLLDVLFVLMAVHSITRFITGTMTKVVALLSGISVLILSVSLSVGPVGLATGIVWCALAVTMMIEGVLYSGTETGIQRTGSRGMWRSVSSISLSIVVPTLVYLVASTSTGVA